MHTDELPRFTYTLGVEKAITYNGKKLKGSKVRARQILVRPGSNHSEKYWLITQVNHIADIHCIGEILIRVRPSAAIDHETFVTVESGMRSGIIGSDNVAVRSKLDASRAEAITIVRGRLLDDWVRLLQDGHSTETDLLEVIAADMALARTLLRKDARARVEYSANFLDSMGRRNPSANAARLTAGIARLRLQVANDMINKKSLWYRYLNCSTLAENIAMDIDSMQYMAYRSDLMESTVHHRFVHLLDRLPIKPYFWAVNWVHNTYSPSEYGKSHVAQAIVSALLAEQCLAEIDMLCSELKRSERNHQREILRIITMILGTYSLTDLSEHYQDLFTDLKRHVRTKLNLSKSTLPHEYSNRVGMLQSMIRNRASLDTESPWYIQDIDKLLGV